MERALLTTRINSEHLSAPADMCYLHACLNLSLWDLINPGITTTRPPRPRKGSGTARASPCEKGRSAIACFSLRPTTILPERTRHALFFFSYCRHHSLDTAYYLFLTRARIPVSGHQLGGDQGGDVQEKDKDDAATTPTMEEEEGEHHCHGDRPLLSACEHEQQQEQDADKPLPLPAKRRSSSLSRSSRSGEQGRDEEAVGPGGAARSLSFSRLFSSFRMMATSTTLDIDELAAAEDGCAALNPQQQQQWKPVCRTQSMPMTSISRRLPAHGSRKRVADSSSLRRFRVSSLSSAAPAPLPESSSPPSSPSPSEEEEVGEEEAVCRICMVALLEEEEEEGGGAAGAGDGVLKLECRCKGELALAHRRCALKGVPIKGNPNCDVCGHDVLNLPVTLRRVAAPPPPPPVAAGDNGTGSQEEGGTARRGFNRGVWRHGTVILVTLPDGHPSPRFCV
uniref:Uncharacterized protein n=1 Tax=Aegilops tauschii TaxID=37682 RepID=R7WGI4_AEGTA